MIHHVVQFALRQRFLVLAFAALVIVAGALSFQRMPVDAYPDLSAPRAEIITQWPGHAAEEVERLVTLPIELQMNATPHMTYMRSISLYGLSDVILTFDEGTDNYFARQEAFQRLSQATLPMGVTGSLSPLSSPSGLVYRYVIDSPDRSPQELKTFEDWVIARAYKSVPGVADDSGFGGTVMQYQVLLDPAKIYNYHIPMPQVLNALSANNANAGGGFYSQGSQFFYVRGLGLVTKTEDIGNIVVGSNNGVPVRIRDVGDVTIGSAPRLGEFGFQKDDDRVEGVILMLTGEQTQNVLKGVEKKTEELNRSILPPDVKIHAFYDRSDLVQLTIDTVEHNLERGMVLVFVVLIFFLVSFRAAVIVALTIPLSLLFAFIFLHGRGVPANLLSIGAIDFGIIIDGTVVMMENIYRELAERHGQNYKLHEVIVSAAHDVDRPIVYSICRDSCRLHPDLRTERARGQAFPPHGRDHVLRVAGLAVFRSHVCSRDGLLLVQGWSERKTEPDVRVAQEWLRKGTEVVPGPPDLEHGAGHDHLRGLASSSTVHRRRVHAALGRGRTLDARHAALYHFFRGVCQVRTRDSQNPHDLPASHRGGLGVGASR